MSLIDYKRGDDDLYCDPDDDLPPQAALRTVKRSPTNATITSSPFSQRESSPPPSVRISEEYVAISREYVNRATQQHNQERDRLTAEISWRERQFKRLADKFVQYTPVRFARPMPANFISQLSEHPQLLLRYFQNERRITGANEYGKWQAQQMNEAGKDGLSSFYAREQLLRQAKMRNAYKRYEAVTTKMFEHIQACLYLLIATEVHDLTDDERLTLLDPMLQSEIVNRNAKLHDDFGELEDIERQVASHRFIDIPKYTGEKIHICMPSRAVGLPKIRIPIVRRADFQRRRIQWRRLRW